jgi:hypothetical protein
MVSTLTVPQKLTLSKNHVKGILWTGRNAPVCSCPWSNLDPGVRRPALNRLRGEELMKTGEWRRRHEPIREIAFGRQAHRAFLFSMALRVGHSEASSGEAGSMMQTAESRYGNYLRIDRRSRRIPPAGWSFVVQTEMTSVLMIVANVLVHQAFQTALAEHNRVVKQITTAGADPAFGHAVLPGASDRDTNRPCAQAVHGFQNLAMECVLAIKDQILWRGIARKGLTKLLSDSGGCRVTGDVAVKNAPPVMVNDEKAVEHAERKSRHGKEIHRSYRFAVNS